MPKYTIALALATLVLSSGCASSSYRIKYIPASALIAEPTTGASVVYGNADEALGLLAQAQLPHNSVRERFELLSASATSLRSNLGSQDYTVLGEIYGGGNAYTDMGSLKAEFAKRAAAVGGDVVMLYRAGIVTRPFIYTSPGYSSTSMQFSATNYGTYTSGSGTANTTFYPGETYSGTMHAPYANAIVFKYVPGSEARRRRVLALSDSKLERVLEDANRLMTTRGMTWDKYLLEFERIVAEAED